MRISAEIKHAAPVETVAQMLADPAFVKAKVERSGSIFEQGDITGDVTGAFTVTSRRSVPTDEIPANIRSFVGAALDVRQVEAWEPQHDGKRNGTIVIEITGAPVRLTGTLRLVPGQEPGTSVEQFEGELKASIPLLGASIEQAAAPAVYAAIDAERAVAAEWLTGDK